MIVANLAHTVSHVSAMATWLFQDQPVAWDPISLWKQMGFIAKNCGRHSLRHVWMVDRRDD